MYVYDDSEIEPDETLTLTLTNPTGATLGDAVATGTIKNDDTAGNAPSQDAPRLTRALASQRYGSRGLSWSVVLEYSRWNGVLLNEASVPAKGDFVVKVDGRRRVVDKVRIQPGSSTNYVMLYLDEPLFKDPWHRDVAATVSYTAGANPIQDRDGNNAASFADRPLVHEYAPSGSMPVALAEFGPATSLTVTGTSSGGVVYADVDPGTLVTLDGSGSSDPDGDPLAFSWSQRSPVGWVERGGKVVPWNDLVVLSGADRARATFVAPVKPGMLDFNLLVSDPSGRADSDMVVLDVRDLAPGFGDAAPGAVTLTPDEEMEPLVLPEATGGNGELTYSLTSEPAGLAGLSFDPVSRTLSGTPTANGTWTVTYTAADADDNTDDDDAARQAFTIHVSDPLAASFHDVPASHDGKSLFSFELRFSENFPGRFDHKILRDRAISVENGRVIRAKRAGAGTEPALDDHGAAAGERRRDRYAGGDGRLRGGGRDMHEGGQDALEPDLGDDRLRDRRLGPRPAGERRDGGVRARPDSHVHEGHPRVGQPHGLYCHGRRHAPGDQQRLLGRRHGGPGAGGGGAVGRDRHGGLRAAG